MTPNNLTAFGSSSVFSTADNFARWLINFDQAAVSGRAAMTLMRTPGALNDGTPVTYGFGITTARHRRYGVPFFTSSGAWASFNAYDAYFPEQKFGVVVLANTDAINAQSAVIKITDIYLEREFAAAAQPNATTRPPRKTSTRRPRRLTNTRESTGSARTRTRASSDTRRIDAYLASVEFERDAAGRLTGLVVNGSARSRDIRFVKRR